MQSMAAPDIQNLVKNAEAGKPDAQFLLSQICQQQNDLDGMLNWLNKSSSNGHVEATGALGHCYERGNGVKPDMKRALDLYEQSVANGSPVAGFHLAQLLYKSSRGPDEQERIRSLLMAAAKADFVLAYRTIGYLALSSRDPQQRAIGWLRSAAEMGDPVSCFNLGWLLSSDGPGGSLSEARHWLQRAAGMNYPLAESTLRALPNEPDLSSGRDVPARSPAVDLKTDFALYPESREGMPDVLHDEPSIARHLDVLTAIDRAYLMFLSRPYLQRAAVIDPDGDSQGMVSNVRTNQSTYIPFELVDIVSRYAELKIIDAVGERLDHSEPMSVLCYAPGECYRPHFDYFNPRLDVSADFMRDGGQRTASAVTYLVAPSSGGGTSFPELNLTVPAASGGTLWFRNCSANGEVDKRSLHAGDPVEAGEKWVVTKWFRERPTRYLQI